jgi:diguanylate cyclase (GGDEF)-like protein
MVRLDKNKIRGGLTRAAVKDSEPTAKPAEATPQASPEGSDLEKFSQYVLKQLIEENVPPTPSNFQIYFEKLLDQKPLSFRKRINELLEADNANDDEQRAKIEREIKEGFTQIKTMLQAIASIYKNLAVMKGLVKKRLDELGINTSQLAVQNVVTTFSNDLNKLSSLMERQLVGLKDGYEKAGATLKSIEQEAIFDTRYGIYNKRYLLKTLESEREGIKKYNYASTLMLLKVKDSALSRIVNSKDRAILLRNISKLLLKTSRRSDVVAHYGEGVFAMVMKHTNIENAKKACDRISELIYATSFFIGEMEVEIDIELSIVELKSEYGVEESLIAALDALILSGRDQEVYAIGELESGRAVESVKAKA